MSKESDIRESDNVSHLEECDDNEKLRILKAEMTAFNSLKQDINLEIVAAGEISLQLADSLTRINLKSSALQKQYGDLIAMVKMLREETKSVGTGMSLDIQQQASDLPIYSEFPETPDDAYEEQPAEKHSDCESQKKSADEVHENGSNPQECAQIDASLAPFHTSVGISNENIENLLPGTSCSSNSFTAGFAASISGHGVALVQPKEKFPQIHQGVSSAGVSTSVTSSSAESPTFPTRIPGESALHGRDENDSTEKSKKEDSPPPGYSSVKSQTSVINVQAPEKSKETEKSGGKGKKEVGAFAPNAPQIRDELDQSAPSDTFKSVVEMPSNGKSNVFSDSHEKESAPCSEPMDYASIARKGLPHMAFVPSSNSNSMIANNSNVDDGFTPVTSKKSRHPKTMDPVAHEPVAHEVTQTQPPEKKYSPDFLSNARTQRSTGFLCPKVKKPTESTKKESKNAQKNVMPSNPIVTKTSVIGNAASATSSSNDSPASLAEREMSKKERKALRNIESRKRKIEAEKTAKKVAKDAKREEQEVKEAEEAYETEMFDGLVKSYIAQVELIDHRKGSIKLWPKAFDEKTARRFIEDRIHDHRTKKDLALAVRAQVFVQNICPVIANKYIAVYQYRHDYQLSLDIEKVVFSTIESCARQLTLSDSVLEQNNERAKEQVDINLNSYIQLQNGIRNHHRTVPAGMKTPFFTELDKQFRSTPEKIRKSLQWKAERKIFIQMSQWFKNAGTSVSPLMVFVAKKVAEREDAVLTFDAYALLSLLRQGHKLGYLFENYTRLILQTNLE